MKKRFLILPLLLNANFAFGYITDDVVGGCVPNTYMLPHFEINQYNCASGYYLPAGAKWLTNNDGCWACPDNATCIGGMYTYDETNTQGIKYSDFIPAGENGGCSEYYAYLSPRFTPNQYNCARGYYLPADSIECVICPNDSYCGGGTYTFNKTTAQGATKCPNGYDYNTDTGKTSVNQCQTHCDAGTYYASGYTQLEYLESTGTQRIDTGTYFMFGDEFFFEYMPIASYSQEDKGYGSGMPLSQEITGGGRRNGNDIVTMYMKQANYQYAPTLSYNSTLGKKYIEHWQISTQTGQLTSTLTDTYGNTYIVSGATFDNNYISGQSVILYSDQTTYAYPSKIRIYRTWLKRQDGTTVFDMIPARRNSDGVLGMYDNVTNTFFTNSGTGTFIAGPDVAPLCTLCPENSYCSGETLNYGATTSNGIIACPDGYGNSVAGASLNTQCYRTCTINDITHSATVTGSVYYNGTNGDGSGTCVPTSCENGWHVNSDMCDVNTITINWSDTDAADIIANNAGTVTYGGDIRTPVKARYKKGQTFIGWLCSRPSGN